MSNNLTNSNGKTLLLLKPRGFCAGVVRAIDIVRIALEAFGPPIYVRKEIVHNRFVVEELQGKGAIFVDSVEEVPNGERVIYSAHGVSPEVREASAARGLRVIDATCPLVTKVHVEAVKFAKEGYSLILIGHHDHGAWTKPKTSSRRYRKSSPTSRDRRRRISVTPPRTARSPSSMWPRMRTCCWS